MNLHQLTNQVLSLVESQASKFVTSPPDPIRQLAAGGLMRSCRLLRGASLLEERGLGDVAGILERQLWETWVVSLYVLLGGDAALRVVADADVASKRKLSAQLKLGIDYQPDGETSATKLNFQRLATELEPLLRRAGEVGKVDTVLGYDLTYRVQSLFTVHAGLSTLARHITYGEDAWSVDAAPEPPFRVLVTASLRTLHLAKYVFEAFGLPTDDLANAWDGLLNMASSDRQP